MTDRPDDEVPAGGDADDTSVPDPDAGGLGALGGLGGLLESAQQAFTAQAAAAQQVVEGRAGGGVVRVSMTGAGEVTAIALAPEVVDPDEIEMLQDLIVAALRDATARVTELQRQALGAFGGLDAGALGDMLGGLAGGPPASGTPGDEGDDRAPGGPSAAGG